MNSENYNGPDAEEANHMIKCPRCQSIDITLNIKNGLVGVLCEDCGLWTQINMKPINKGDLIAQQQEDMNYEMICEKFFD